MMRGEKVSLRDNNFIFPKFHAVENRFGIRQFATVITTQRDTLYISLAAGSVHIWSMYNLEDIVTFSVGGKRAGKWQGRAVFAPTLIPFAGRAI